MDMHKKGLRLGFTLIELLVVLAILAVMMTLAVPRYYSQLDASKEVVLRENLRAVRETIDRFYGDRGRYPENLEELVELKYLAAKPFDPITESSSSWVTEAVPAGYKGSLYNIRSGSSALDKQGRPYASW